ncbi:MAG: hypothetical protein F6K17_26130 [Okeania sp. SIO3C4]|nr:hypothetical protein [Okeania sp. SIO3C4]
MYQRQRELRAEGRRERARLEGRRFFITDPSEHDIILNSRILNSKFLNSAQIKRKRSLAQFPEGWDGQVSSPYP